MEAKGFTSTEAARIAGVTPRQLGYWCTTGLVVPSERTPGGHARYAFRDLLALTTARRLIDSGVSVQRIRKAIAALVRFLPTVTRPLADISLVATGDVVLVFQGGAAFEALSGQEWVFPVADLVRRVARERRNPNEPEQGELFGPGTDDLPATGGIAG